MTYLASPAFLACDLVNTAGKLTGFINDNLAVIEVIVTFYRKLSYLCPFITDTYIVLC